MCPPAPRLFFLIVLLVAVSSTQSRLEGSGVARVRPSPTEFSARYLQNFTEDVESSSNKTEAEKDEKEDGLLGSVTSKVNDVKNEGEAFINTPITDWGKKEWSIAGASIMGAMGILACIFKCFCPCF